VTIKTRLVKLESRNSKPLITLEEIIAERMKIAIRLGKLIISDDCPNCSDCTTQELCRKAEMLSAKAGL
jgi:endonuclease III